jgi:predicted ATPase/class 3 adenylate cyclase
MRCSLCGVENREGAKFCGGCGTLLTLNCPQCGAELSHTHRFCDSCGAVLSTESADTIAVRNDSPANRPGDSDTAGGSASRRQMSLMCCDLVDSGLMARRLDPEDLRYAISNFHQISKLLIDQYEGYYAHHMGDGFMAYFSYPTAHEDDAYRAVLTGLRIIDAIGRFNIDLKKKHNIALHLRIGVDTGEVVVDRFVVGTAPNVASRVQAAAPPDTVVITETTRRLLPADVFVYEDLGVHELKNVGSLRLFRVLERKGPDESQSDVRPKRPMVGRRKQLALLADHWELVKDGSGQAIIVAGEPGIGKSKLVEWFLTDCGAVAHAIVRLHGSPFHTNTMLHPFAANIRAAAKIVPSDGDAEQLEKLSSFLRRFGNLDKMLPLLSRLLFVSAPSSLRQMPPQRLLQQTLEVLIDIAVQHANQGATMFIFEDMHWFDPTTMSLLEVLIPLISNHRALLLLTTRSTSTPQLQDKYYLTQIALSRLQLNEVHQLVQLIAGDAALPQSMHHQIVARANGVPLYAEELTKMVLEAEFTHDAKVQHEPMREPHATIPLTLRDPLTSRVDRVKGRRILQLAATLGREFSYELLLAISSHDREELSRELRHLVTSELLYQKGPVLEAATFEFKHSLICDAAYSLLTKADRERYHQKIGHLLEERFSEIATAHPEIVAHHYTQARSYEKALHSWYEAGRQSAARAAHSEAVGHLKQGLNLIPNIGDPALRNRSELLLQTALGNSLRVSEGWSTDGVKRAYARALQLCEESGLDEHILPAVFGLWTWHFVRADLADADDLAEQLLNKAEAADNSAYRGVAHEALGLTLFAHGNFTEAHAQLERSISLCEDDKTVAAALFAQDPRVHVRLYDAMTLWFLGYPDQALRLCAEARFRADVSQDPFSQAMAQTISLRVHQLRGEPAAVLNQADAAIAVCQEYDIVHYRAMALILRGWARAQQGDFETGIAEIQDGLEIERGTGALLYESYTLGLLADACMKNEGYEQAFNYLDQARLRIEEGRSDRFYAAEIYRMSGEACLRSTRDLDQAERYLLKGLALAREQHAKSLELRLSISIWDLYEVKQTADSYRQRFGDLYTSFTEGFDTVDLVRAKAIWNTGSLPEAAGHRDRA